MTKKKQYRPMTAKRYAPPTTISVHSNDQAMPTTAADKKQFIHVFFDNRSSVSLFRDTDKVTFSASMTFLPLMMAIQPRWPAD